MRKNGLQISKWAAAAFSANRRSKNHLCSRLPFTAWGALCTAVNFRSDDLYAARGVDPVVFLASTQLMRGIDRVVGQVAEVRATPRVAAGGQ